MRQRSTQKDGFAAGTTKPKPADLKQVEVVEEVPKSHHAKFKRFQQINNGGNNSFFDKKFSH